MSVYAQRRHRGWDCWWDRWMCLHRWWLLLLPLRLPRLGLFQVWIFGGWMWERRSPRSFQGSPRTSSCKFCFSVLLFRLSTLKMFPLAWLKCRSCIGFLLGWSSGRPTLKEFWTVCFELGIRLFCWGLRRTGFRWILSSWRSKWLLVCLRLKVQGRGGVVFGRGEGSWCFLIIRF